MGIHPGHSGMLPHFYGGPYTKRDGNTTTTPKKKSNLEARIDPDRMPDRSCLGASLKRLSGTGYRRRVFIYSVREIRWLLISRMRETSVTFWPAEAAEEAREGGKGTVPKTGPAPEKDHGMARAMGREPVVICG